MEKSDHIPKRLYKYRPFSGQTLEMLVADRLYFADPSTFNDPLDTKPSLNADINSDELEQIYTELVKQRESDEMTAAARTIKYRGPRTIEHISRHSKRQAERLIKVIKYNADNPVYKEKKVGNPLLELLGKYVEVELLRRYRSGTFSLAQRYNCPLMWSHYGDQHRGICIGYSVPTNSTTNIHKVKYGGSRLVEASTVAAMLKNDEEARRKVDRAVLLKKAKSWHYEKEWRVIGQRGIQDSNLELEEIIFGILCRESVKYAIVKALEGRSRSVKFYEMHPTPGTFLLKRYTLDEDELSSCFPKRAIEAIEGFFPVPEDEIK